MTDIRLDRVAVRVLSVAPIAPVRLDRVAVRVLVGKLPATEATWWDGTSRNASTLRGWWDGTQIQSVTVKGWWDGTQIVPL